MTTVLKSLAVGMVVLAFTAQARAEGPEALVGTWTWNWKDAEGVVHTHKLEVEGSGDKVAAREKYDDMEPVKVTDLKLAGTKVTFSVLRGMRQSNYSGVLKNKDLIEGVVNVAIEGQVSEFGWEARRQPLEKK